MHTRFKNTKDSTSVDKQESKKKSTPSTPSTLPSKTVVLNEVTPEPISFNKDNDCMVASAVTSKQSKRKVVANDGDIASLPRDMGNELDNEHNVTSSQKKKRGDKKSLSSSAASIFLDDEAKEEEEEEEGEDLKHDSDDICDKKPAAIGNKTKTKEGAASTAVSNKSDAVMVDKVPVGNKKNNEQRTSDDISESPTEDGDLPHLLCHDERNIPVGGGLGSRMERGGGSSLKQDLVDLPAKIKQPVRIFVNGKLIVPNRLFTMVTQTNQILMVTMLPQAFDRMPAVQYEMEAIMADAQHYQLIRRKFNFHAIMSLRSDNAMEPLDGNRKGALQGYPWRVFVRCRTKYPNQKLLNEWGNQMAGMLTAVSKNLKYPMIYQYYGDITPPKPQKVCYYLTVSDVLDLLRILYPGETLGQLMERENLGLYFDDATLALARNAASNRTMGNADGFNDAEEFICGLNGQAN